jgi:hypothetical protein
MRTFLRAGRVSVGLLSCLLVPAAGLGLLVGRYPGPALSTLALALSATLLMIGQAWPDLAPETREVVALGIGILGLQFAGGVLIRQALAAWTARGAFAQGALAGMALALGLVWLPDVRTEMAALAPAPPVEARVFLLGLERAIDYRFETALAETRNVAVAIARVAEQRL